MEIKVPGGYLMAARTCAAALVMCGMAAMPASAQDTPSTNLYLDTGGHLAFIKDIAFSPDGELLLSASDDKTIRVWDWHSGTSLRIIRGQIGPGNEGKVFAIDVAPDGRTVAAGGWFGPGPGDTPPYGDVRLFDIRTGRMLSVLKGHDYPVYDLDFSPDGNLLAAGGQDGYVHVWRRDDGAENGWATLGVLDADAMRVEKVSFALDGRRIVVATADNGLRLFDVATGETIAMDDAEPLRDVRLSALAVSPDGTTFATGDADGGVRLWRAEDGALDATLPPRDHLIGTLSFTADGTRLIASCGYRCEGGYGVAAWALSTPDAPATVYQGHDNTVLASAAGPEAGIVATAGGERHEIHLWDAGTGTRLRVLQGSGAPVTAVGISADGGVVAWGTVNPCPDSIACPDLTGALEGEMLMPTPDRGFETPERLGASGATFRRALLSDGEWSLRHAAGGDNELPNAVLEILRGGEVVNRITRDATDGYQHSAYTLLADGRGIVSGGSDGTLLLYDRESGDLKGEFIGHAGDVLAIAEAPEAGLLITGSADQSMRLWNVATQALVASMHVSGGQWIVWTPQGYFHSSPNGDEIVGWQVNQGQDIEARYLKARQLRRHLSSPEIVRRAIIARDASNAARELRGTDNELRQLLERKPPDFEIRVIETDPPARDGHIAIEITGVADAGAEVERFSVLANDRQISQFETRSVDGPDGGRVVIEVPVSEGENEILVSGVNAFGYITERGVKALAKGPSSEKPKGKLYVVAVGVNDYPYLPSDCGGRSCDLRFPVADASTFMEVVADRTAPLHAEMEALLIVNREALDDLGASAATLAGITDGGRRILEPEARTIRDEIIDFLDLPGPDDTTIIFIAGHGINVDEEYYVIPTDGRKQDGDRWRRSSLVAWSDIHEAIERAKGRRFLLIDTCHAANAFNASLEKEAADARIVVLAATAANNTAAELANLGHGVFTYAVLEGMRGGANTGGDGVRILGLSDFVDREVRRMTNARQEPFYHLPRTENFLVARP